MNSGGSLQGSLFLHKGGLSPGDVYKIAETGYNSYDPARGGVYRCMDRGASGRMIPFRERLNISTMAEDAPELAGEYGLGLEIAEFCTAYNMDLNFPDTDAKARSAMERAPGRVFHAPFAELCPAAIDPLVREVTRKRYLRAIGLARSYGIRKIVIHAGFIPQVYWPEWFVPQSVEFWKNLLPEIGPDMLLCLENVMEPDADMLVSIVEETGDPRLRLCLDTGHAASRPCPVPIEEWIDKEAPYLAHLHIHNNDGTRDRHASLGNGILNMRELIDRVEKLCPEATYSLENLTAADSVAWLRENRYI